MENNDHKASKLKACALCMKDEDNELLFGKFHHRATVSAHSNCLLFSSGLVQQGKRSREGIIGFLCRDIKKEVLRGKKLRCYYCKDVGATIGCIKSACRRSFHFPCGVRHHTVHQYFNNFPSYCELHKPRQKNVDIKNDLYCYICRSSISEVEMGDCLYAPCCKNNWFHILCLQQYALSAGRHFFKCPLCNNSSEFVEEMRKCGIHIPEKDADWELEENAYQELLYRPECDSSVCKDVKGGKHNGYGVWTLLPCSSCGGRATHRYCRGLEDNQKSWMCGECEVIHSQLEENKTDLSVESLSETRPSISHPDNHSAISNSVEMGSDSTYYCSNVSDVLEFLKHKPVLKIILKKTNFNEFLIFR